MVSAGSHFTSHEDRDTGTGLYSLKDCMVMSNVCQAMGRLFPHHVGHYLGMDTHDTMLIDRNSILNPGMVITIEPGVYISKDFPCSSPASME